MHFILLISFLFFYHVFYIIVKHFVLLKRAL